MLRLVRVLAVFAFACGRYSFDSHPDARHDVNDVNDVSASDTGNVDVLLGHDEDGDGIPDTADFCPHIADAANLDGDGDLVGDVCDPQPALAVQQWVLFSPMGTLPMFNAGPSNAWTMNGDDWHYDDAASQCSLIRMGAYANLDVWVGFQAEVLGTGGIQAAIVINGVAPYWYGEIFDGGAGSTRLSITEYDGSSYIARSTKVIGATFPVVETDLHLAARVGGSFTATSGIDTVTYLTPGYAGDQFLYIAFGNHSGRVRYLAIVQSN